MASNDFDSWIKETAQEEAAMMSAWDDRIWRAYDSGKAELDLGFYRVMKLLGLDSLEGTLTVLQASAQRQPIGLELAGQGKVFAELGITGVAVCLALPEFLVDPSGDDRNPRRRDCSSVALIDGDIGREDTWAKIGKRIHADRLEKPNLVLLTPAGGKNRLPEGQEFVERVVRPVLNIADKETVVFLGEAPQYTDYALEQFLVNLQAKTRTRVALIPNADGGKFGIRLSSPGVEKGNA